MDNILKEEIDEISEIPLPFLEDKMTIDEDHLERLISESLDRCLKTQIR